MRKTDEISTRNNKRNATVKIAQFFLLSHVATEKGYYTHVKHKPAVDTTTISADACVYNRGKSWGREMRALSIKYGEDARGVDVKRTTRLCDTEADRAILHACRMLKRCTAIDRKVALYSRRHRRCRRCWMCYDDGICASLLKYSFDAVGPSV